MNLYERSQVFMNKAKKLHGDKYDYSKVVYTNSYTKVIIGCNNCGKLFDQAPMSHISTSHPCGCPHCRYQRCHKPKPSTTLTTGTFITKAIGVHGSNYIYDLVNYVNSRTKINITCPTHGIFEQTPNGHLLGSGCSKCGHNRKLIRLAKNRLTIEEFIRRSRERYGERYNYNKSVYIASDKPITITCGAHGDFIIARAEKHLTGQACPTCCKSNGSSFELYIATLLSTHNISYEREKTFDGCRSPITNRRLKYDFYLSEFNTLIEFDGIQHHQPVKFFNKRCSFEKMQLHDLTKTNYAKEVGIMLIRFTISNIDDIKKLLTHWC